MEIYMVEKKSRRRNNVFEMGLRERNYLLYIGSLTKREGAHYLIEAFKQLENTAKTPNNLKLAIVANGDGDDQDYVKYLLTISEKRDNIIFFCVRNKILIKQLISSAYLYVQPSEDVLQRDILSQVMKHGLAPLVSDLKENVEFVGEGAFVFVFKSVLSLRDRLAYLLSRPQEVSLMGERAKKCINKYLKQASALKDKSDSGKKIILEKKFIWNWKKLLKKV
ncbi:MAG: hypothetical protein ACD_9C00189G0004 [uncultured bacterium]|nr:MAG: hypothetical protein ACD_9C00189G0004 [uncultured bacterium]